MIEEKIISNFQNKLLNWFTKHGRNFPWRKNTITPYQVIISEVLLQRTKAETVAKIYPSFIKKYPSWTKLANATSSELEEELRPMGLYKQRSERLLKLSQEMKKRNGRFPKEIGELSSPT
jgi:A/G-specific adenine glycosylase